MLLVRTKQTLVEIIARARIILLNNSIKDII
jgi:hypothetical protein